MELLKIALCDDNKQELEALEQYIIDYSRAGNSEIHYDKFSNATELLARVSSGVAYDLIFLDIVMPIINGIDAAKEIYFSNKVTQFVFVTSSSDYAVESYSVNALDYILKPINKKNFDRAMHRFEERYTETHTNGIIISDSKSIVHVASHSLAYVEVLDHHLMYHIAGSDAVRTRQTMSQIEGKLLQSSNFVKTHRSFIVNMDYVYRIEPSFITMTNGDRVSITKDKYKTICDTFLNYKKKSGVTML